MRKTGKRKLPLSAEKETEEEDFVSAYDRLVKSVVSDFIREIGDYSLNFDDLYQEGMLALFYAAKNFRNTGEAAFVTYAYIAIKNRIVKEAKRYNNIYSHELSYSKDPEKYEKLFADEDSPSYDSLVRDLFKRLNPNDRMIFELYLRGKSYAEIATITNTNIKKVDNRLCLIKKKLNKYWMLEVSDI